MSQHFFIGVDGGATKCIVRVEDDAGNLLGRATSGPANIRLSVSQAWQSINDALYQILAPHQLSLTNKNHYFHIGMGLAGCEIASAYQDFIDRPHPFYALKVTSDAHTACLGAHHGKDGAIIIAGTGVIGWQVQHGKSTRAGGWGFPYDDVGGGAWLGLEAVKITLQAWDGRLAASGLSDAIYAHFHASQADLINWASAANSTFFAELAPLVIEQYKKGDRAATQLLQSAAQAVDKIWDALLAKQDQGQPLFCSMAGGISPFLAPFLSDRLRARLVAPGDPADAGAVWLIKRCYKLSR